MSPAWRLYTKALQKKAPNRRAEAAKSWARANNLAEKTPRQNKCAAPDASDVSFSATPLNNRQ